MFVNLALFYAILDTMNSTQIKVRYLPKGECKMRDQPYSQSCTTLKDTGFGYTLAMIGGKYKIIVIYWLYESQSPMRYNQLKRSIGTISFKTLTNTLRELEADGLVIRKEYPQIPPKVEYSLSERGISLVPIIDQMCNWGEIDQQRQEQQEKTAMSLD